MRFNRDPAFPLQVHGIKKLILLFSFLNCACALKQPIRQRRFAVIDMRDDAEVARKLNCHGRWHYASGAARGQLMQSRDDARLHNLAKDSRTGKPDVDSHRLRRNEPLIKSILCPGRRNNWNTSRRKTDK
jgi:hypothetical protein